MEFNSVIILARSFLEKNARIKQCVSYKDFAIALNITEPPVIKRVALVLEKMLEEDAKQKKPLLAALVVQKGKKKIPRSGFFEKLMELKLIESCGDEFDEITWHAEELNKLKAFYSK